VSGLGRLAPGLCLAAALVLAPGAAADERLAAARAALESRDFTRAAELYAEVLRDADPDFQLPRIGYALSQMALGEDELALAVVLEGLARDPDQPELLELHGDLYDRQERVPDALAAWRAAFERTPSDRLRQKILRAERELHAGRDYDLTTTAHFNLRYDGTVGDELARDVIDHLERSHARLTELLRHAPRQPVTVLLYPDRQFREATQAAEWVGGLYDGKIRLPLGGLRQLDPLARGVLDHELAHAVIHAKTRGNCPRWLHEGLAQIAEGRQLTFAERQAVAARVGERAPERWEDGGFSYPIALSLTRHLESRRGMPGIVRLLDGLGRGESLDAALLAEYGVDHAGLCADWQRAMAARSVR
jgi:tetratricopeptide (TPR) repeat protein